MVAGELARDVIEEHHGWNRVREVEQRGAGGKEILQPRLPARCRLAAEFIRPGEVKLLRARKIRKK
jgi:hypothetical protein